MIHIRPERDGKKGAPLKHAEACKILSVGFPVPPREIITNGRCGADNAEQRLCAALRALSQRQRGHGFGNDKSAEGAAVGDAECSLGANAVLRKPQFIR